MCMAMLWVSTTAVLWVNSVAAIWVKEKWVKAAAPWLTSKNNEKTRQNKKNRNNITIKFEPQSSNYLHLENEYNVYKSIGNHIGLPCLKWFGQEHNQRVLVLSLLGPSLENHFVASGCHFELRTVLAIANQMVCSFLWLYTYFWTPKLAFPSGIKAEHGCICRLPAPGPTGILDFKCHTCTLKDFFPQITWICG